MLASTCLRLPGARRSDFCLRLSVSVSRSDLRPPPSPVRCLLPLRIYLGLPPFSFMRILYSQHPYFPEVRRFPPRDCVVLLVSVYGAPVSLKCLRSVVSPAKAFAKVLRFLLDAAREHGWPLLWAENGSDLGLLNGDARVSWARVCGGSFW